ncbi:MAG: hypothetical protein V8S81_06075 [Oscillospiraceae bacterium]
MKKGTGRPETGNFDPAIGSAAEKDSDRRGWNQHLRAAENK